MQDQRAHEFNGLAQILIHKIVKQDEKKSVQLMDELEVLAAPLIEFLHNNFNPHCHIEITQDFTRVVVDVIGIPKTN
ncbi:hypothetical protein [Solibacillus sp. FSL K6-1523]|uniref:hypothetical protein n=1 Tax=Solibacillus sp. FSL K6-1523 TaxID=2921471 RepID=UPI0030FB05AB